MSKYIDAQELLHYLLELRKEYKYSDISSREIFDIIRKFPAADVHKTIRSTWKRGENFGGEYLECVACGHKIRPTSTSKNFFCPNCGAKMEENNKTCGDN